MIDTLSQKSAEAIALSASGKVTFGTSGSFTFSTAFDANVAVYVCHHGTVVTIACEDTSIGLNTATLIGEPDDLIVLAGAYVAALALVA